MILLSLGTGLLIAGLLVVFQSRVQTVKGSVVEASRLIEEVTSSIGLGSSFEIPDEPARLRIPSIGVDANIQSVGLLKNGSMGIPTNFTDVAWYNRGVRPGVPGNAVIDGHFDGRKVPRAVFYSLGDLKPGDLVEVVDQRGKTFRFQVVSSKTYKYKDPTDEIFSGDASKARLNLITCAGDWIKSEKSYSQRIVVFTELLTTN